jgi:predicted nucleic acid-binding protein
MLIYLDNCCYNRPFDEPSQVRIVNEANAKMAIQRAISNGKLDLVISYILYSENKRGPNAMAKDYNLDFMKKYHKIYVGIDKLDSLQPLITEIMATGIKSADATHIACAISAGCDYLITTDDRMLKFKDERIKIITPTDMVYIMEV